MKIFGNKPIERVWISKFVQEPYKEQLKQAKGVMENYLRDKNFNVTIIESSYIWGEEQADYLDIQGATRSAMNLIQIRKESDTPFLRKVYKALEIFAKDPNLK